MLCPGGSLEAAKLPPFDREHRVLPLFTGAWGALYARHVGMANEASHVGLAKEAAVTCQ